MKQVKSLIKLTNLNSERLELEGKDLHHVIGAYSCGCYYKYCGGSSKADNNAANLTWGYESIEPTKGPYGFVS